MKHPFQRRSNAKHTVTTPFQRELVRFIDRFGGSIESISGRQLSSILGRSANHLSQMLNDGFVPAGSTILEMAEIMGLKPPETDLLIRAAMETKAGQRSRDNFWINESLRMLKEADREREHLADFLEQEGLTKKFQAYLASRPKPRPPRRKD